MYRKRGYIIARIVGFLAVLVMAAILAVQTPLVQTWLSRIGLRQLEKVLDGRVHYDELKVTTSGVLVIRNLTLVDGSPYTEDAYGRGWAPVDTVFHARSVTATFTLAGLFKGEGLHMGRVTVEDGFFHLVTEPLPSGTNLTRILGLPPQKGPAEPGPDIFDIKKLRVRNFRFQLNSFLERKVLPKDNGVPKIDFDDLDVLVEEVTGHNMRMAGGKMSAFCDHLRAVEKSGYVIEDLTGSCDVGLGKALVEDIHLTDPWSEVRLRYYSMTYPWAIAFRDFIGEVKLEAEFQPTKLALQSLSYFTGIFGGASTVLDIRRGHLVGYVNDFRVDRLDFSDAASGVSTILDGTCIGLPDVQQMLLDVRLQDLRATTEGLTRTITGVAPRAKVDLGGYARNLPMTLQLAAQGPLDRLQVSGTLDTPDGAAAFDGNVRNLLDPRRKVEASADLSLQELNLGRVLGQDGFGPVTLQTRAHATLGKGLPNATLDTLHIEKIHALGRDFEQIDVAGSLTDGTLEARLRSADAAARLDLTATADLQDRDGSRRYRIDGDISEVDLTAFGVADDRPYSHLSSRIQADLVQVGDFFRGDASLQGLSLLDTTGVHPVGDLLLGARIEPEGQVLNLEAPFLEATFSGNRPVWQFIADAQAATVGRDLPALFPNVPASEPGGRYSLGMLFHNTRDILAMLLPGAYVADNTTLHMDMQENGLLGGSILSDRLALGKNFLKDVDIEFDNQGGSLFAALFSSEMRAGSFAMSNPSISAEADDDDLSLGIHYDSFSGAGGNADLYLDGQVYRDSLGVLVVKAHPLNSYLTTGDDTWTLGESDIVLHGKDLYFNQFNISNGPQQLLVDGGVSSAGSDTLTLRMDRFDLALVDEFLPNPLGIEGKMNGRAFLTSETDRTHGMLMDFQIDTLRLGGVDAGTIQLSSMWNDEGKELGLLLRDRLDGRDALFADGSYFVGEKRLDVRANLDHLPLEVAAPFLTQVFSEMGGGISGNIRLAGPTGQLSPSSDDLQLEDALIRVAATGVPYTVQGPLHIGADGCFFDALQVRDDTGGTGTIGGSIRYANLQDFTLDSRLSFNRLKVVDTPEKPGSPFYGLVRASGTASVSGPFDALLIDANVSTAGEGNIHIPLSGSLASSSGNLLTFTEPTRVLDPYEQMLAEMETETTRSSDIRIRGRLTVHPDLKGFVEIDKNAGNIASFSGLGTVNLNLRPSRAVFNLNGDYNINEGNYQFVVPGILSKGFDIQQGSTVKFGGDIMNTELDITATHNVRTSLDALLGTNTGIRRPVECALNVTDRLRAPQLALDIEIPDLDPTTRSQVETALNTTDKVQKQFVSLLLLGSFLPNESSGVTNQSNLLFSNVVEMMSGQVNNILQRLDIPLDVGFAYQEAQSGQNLFDVAVSTQLFENRVIVGGSFGNRRYSTGGSAGDFAGDLDIQVKLDPEGKFRFNIFSHSADELTNYLDFSQRNGVGVSYQKEYSSVGDFFRSLFTPRKQREQEAAPIQQEQTVIEIEKDENDSGQTVPDPDPAR
ncbi:MAG: translocation/assembly module TamB domain-containing protein [Bacteroidales bacterium]|nr:translocation/assembly module TamB domain-containing protein [Bacteroidales bacterium]